MTQPIHGAAAVAQAPRPFSPGRGRQKARAALGIRPDLLMKLVGAIVMSSVWRFQDVFPGLSGLKLPLVISSVAVIVWILDTSRGRRLKELQSPITVLLILLSVQLVLATVTSLSYGRSQSFLLRDFSWTFVTYVLVATGIRNLRDLRWLAVVHVVGAVTFCALVFARFRALDNIGRLCCVPYYDANDISLVTVSTLPFFFFFLRDTAPARARLWMLAGIVPVLVVFQLAGSRGGMIGLAVVIALVLASYSAIKPRTRMTSVIVAVAALAILGGSAYRQKFVSIFHSEDDYNRTEEEGRIGMWKSGIALARQRPLTGFGPRSFGEAYGTYSPRAVDAGGVPWRAAHSAYVELMAEAGFPAVLIFAAMLITAVVQSFRIRQRAGRPHLGPDGQVLAMLALSNAIGLIGYIVTAIFLSAEYLTIIYVMFGMTVAMTRILRQMEESTSPGNARSPRRRHASNLTRVARPQVSSANA